MDTVIQKLDSVNGNQLFIKRDDLYPFSFGGNKARKGMLFWKEIREKNINCLVTYGSSSSNHCRVIANIAASDKIPCYIISPEEVAKETYNRKIMEKLGAKIEFCNINKVKETIEFTVNKLEKQGFRPYFIQGGGHGNIGTQAYVECFDEIRRFEEKQGIKFDYIFLASGTGTTQAGLVCGKLLNSCNHKIIGISIARKNPYGREIVKKSIKEFLEVDISEEIIDKNVIFDDSCTVNGYGKSNAKIKEIINQVMKTYGIQMDSTYTGKAFWGMNNYINQNDIEGKNILFIHTGGTPLFFDELGEC